MNLICNKSLIAYCILGFHILSYSNTSFAEGIAKSNDFSSKETNAEFERFARSWVGLEPELPSDSEEACSEISSAPLSFAGGVDREWSIDSSVTASPIIQGTAVRNSNGVTNLVNMTHTLSGVNHLLAMDIEGLDCDHLGYKISCGEDGLVECLKCKYTVTKTVNLIFFSLTNHFPQTYVFCADGTGYAP